MRKGILIVSFGTTYRETRERNIERIVQDIMVRYPNCEIYQAYSSDKVRHVLKKRDDVHIPSIAEALDRMKEEGIKNVLVLPTHIIDGYENHKMKDMIERYKVEFDRISVAGALLEQKADYAAVAAALWDSIKEKSAERTVILMGHGSYHEADESYSKMEQALREYSGREIYIATVEGSVSIEDVLRRMKTKQEEGKREGSSVLITPFMLVAGDHAENDMAGKEDSFLTKVQEAGYQAECLLRGIGEYESIRNIYLEHLKAAERGTI